MPFSEFGSWFGGVQAGYDYMLRSPLVVGVAAQHVGAKLPKKISTDYRSAAPRPCRTDIGQESLSETVLDMGTVRGLHRLRSGRLALVARDGWRRLDL